MIRLVFVFSFFILGRVQAANSLPQIPLVVWQVPIMRANLVDEQTGLPHYSPLKEFRVKNIALVNDGPVAGRGTSWRLKIQLASDLSLRDWVAIPVPSEEVGKALLRLITQSPFPLILELDHTAKTTVIEGDYILIGDFKILANRKLGRNQHVFEIRDASLRTAESGYMAPGKTEMFMVEKTEFWMADRINATLVSERSLKRVKLNIKYEDPGEARFVKFLLDSGIPTGHVIERSQINQYSNDYWTVDAKELKLKLPADLAWYYHMLWNANGIGPALIVPKQIPACKCGGGSGSAVFFYVIGVGYGIEKTSPLRLSRDVPHCVDPQVPLLCVDQWSG